MVKGFKTMTTHGEGNVTSKTRPSSVRRRNGCGGRAPRLRLNRKDESNYENEIPNPPKSQHRSSFLPSGKGPNTNEGEAKSSFCCGAKAIDTTGREGSFARFSPWHADYSGRAAEAHPRADRLFKGINACREVRRGVGQSLRRCRHADPHR